MLRLVRKKRRVAGAKGSRKKTDVEKFISAIDVQLRLAQGQKVRKGRGVARSWMVDGNAYGVGRILVPRVGTKQLYGKSAIVVDASRANPPTAELNELRSRAVEGKLTAKINRVAKGRASRQK